jgi:murein DD-endopeptidase MepM/ murein hydrolase activator NlpD
VTRTQLVFLSCVIALSALAARPHSIRSAVLDVDVRAKPVIARIDGRRLLVYELHVTNFNPGPVALIRIDVFHQEALLHSFADTELRDGLARVGARTRIPDPQTVAPGQRVVFYVWLPLPDGKSVSAVRHRIAFRTDDGSETVTDATEVQIAGPAPPQLGPPLRGGPWVAIYDPDLRNGHRRAIFAVDGRARIPARFAIDWIKLGPDGRSVHDNPSIVSNSYSYGEDVLAVADGVVVDLEDAVPEPTPNIAIENEAGNYVAIDLGGSRFAFYEHLKPQSIRVKLHQRVQLGQVLGSVGASGSVFSGAHLHFHVADGRQVLAAEGVPFTLRSYWRLGSFPSFDALQRPWTAAAGDKPTRRYRDGPAPLTVVNFD